ncbi:MAG: hypothetical protein A3F91_09270 [Flavobacteria bacterium RIFCSPLOWO2_12_FULL_35_11]|nr:MAG: hypothetical protein A3F91_09270 [Flavobacteria bacterium RIFCSPLOWO2_12_FULL_35_11]
MGLLLVFFSLALGAFASLQLVSLPKIDVSGRITGGYSPNSSSLVNEYEIKEVGNYSEDGNHSIARNADIAAIRVCRQLSYEMKEKFLAGDISCASYNTPAVLFGFLGASGTSGYVDTLYVSTSSPTLVCATVEQYGRYIFSRSLPKGLILGKNVTYNLNALSADKPDPCGYNEIVY